jgi:hypothetical protein
MALSEISVSPVPKYANPDSFVFIYSPYMNLSEIHLNAILSSVMEISKTCLHQISACILFLTYRANYRSYNPSNLIILGDL